MRRSEQRTQVRATQHNLSQLIVSIWSFTHQQFNSRDETTDAEPTEVHPTNQAKNRGERCERVLSINWWGGGAREKATVLLSLRTVLFFAFSFVFVSLTQRRDYSRIISASLLLFSSSVLLYIKSF